MIAFLSRMIWGVGEDMHGVCTRPFLIGKSGDVVYKALKKRLVSGAVLLGTVVYLGNKAFDLDFKGLYIALLTLGVAGAGFAAQKWGRWVLDRSLNFAESHGANLLEQMKQKRFEQRYLPELYARVYRPEAEVLYPAAERAAAAERHEALLRETVCERLTRYSADERILSLLDRHPERLGIMAVPGLSTDTAAGIDPRFFAGPGRVRALMLTGAELDLGEYVVRRREIMMSWVGFAAGTKYLLERSDRQRSERTDSGIDLSFLDDYLDGAPFHPGNTGVIEQGSHALMQEIDAAVGKRSLLERLDRSIQRFLQKRWHATITTSVQASIGSLLHDLVKSTGAESLAVEDVLWQDEASRSLLVENLLEEVAHAPDPEAEARGIVAELEAGGRRILMKIFHETREKGERVIRRQYGFSIQDSVMRRLHYDPEYALGELTPGPMEDLRRARASRRVMGRADALVASARELMAGFPESLPEPGWADWWADCTPETRRALRVACLINHADFRQAVRRGQAFAQARVLAEQFTAEASRNLRRLRLHHQLALFEFIDAVALLDELVYDKIDTSDHPAKEYGRSPA